MNRRTTFPVLTEYHISTKVCRTESMTSQVGKCGTGREGGGGLLGGRQPFQKVKEFNYVQSAVQIIERDH